jgi:WD40 repeat protein
MADQPDGKGRRKRDPAIIAAWILGVLGVVGVVAGVLLTHVLEGSSQPSTAPSSPPVTANSPSVRQSAASPGVPIPVYPASRLHDPDSAGVYGVAFSSSGTLAAGDLNGSGYLWDVAKDKVTGTFPDSNGEGIFGVALSPDGTMLAASTVNVHDGYRNGSVVVWNTSSGKLIDTLNGPNSRAFGSAPPAFSPDGSTVAAPNANGSVYIWHTATGKPAGTLPNQNGQSDYGIAFSPATGLLASANDSGTTFLWNTKNDTIVQMFQDPDRQAVRSVAFSPDGSTLAAGDLNGNVYLWNAATGAPMATLYGPKGGLVQSIAFSPRGGILAGTSDDVTDHKYVTCVWDTTGKLLATFQDPGSYGVTRIAFSPDGGILAVGDQNGYTYIWNMNWHSS